MSGGQVRVENIGVRIEDIANTIIDVLPENAVSMEEEES